MLMSRLSTDARTDARTECEDRARILKQNSQKYKNMNFQTLNPFSQLTGSSKENYLHCIGTEKHLQIRDLRMVFFAPFLQYGKRTTFFWCFCDLHSPL